VIPVDGLDLPTARTAAYARTISSNVRALHVTDDPERGQQLKREWESRIFDVPFTLIISPYRSLVAPVLSHIDAMDRVDPGAFVTIVLPEYRTVWPWQRWLHNQSARRLKNALIERRNTVIIEVPYQLRVERDEAADLPED
jgi:hypothetical protein